MFVLVTGATGKVGRRFVSRFLADPVWFRSRVRALCHNRRLPEIERVEVAFGSIADRRVCAQAMTGVTHVVHLATCKETPDDVIDVTVKGLFWLLEEFRKSTRGLDSIDIPSRRHSNWMDNSQAKFHLAWRPTYDFEKLIDSAWEHQRSADDPRRVWRPG